MPYKIECLEKKEGCKGAYARNIVDLLDNYRDDSGYFRCNCGGAGYIPKHFTLQEGDTWEPNLRGAIRFWEPGEPGVGAYCPYVFLATDSHAPPNSPVRAAWFCYYKDTSSQGGILKHGHGPGGPPVLGFKNIVELVGKLKDMRLIA